MIAFCLTGAGNLSLSAQSSVEPKNDGSDLIRDAGNEAIDTLILRLMTIPDLPKRFAVLPFKADYEEAYFTAQLRNAVARHGSAKGIKLFTRDGDALGRLLDEIAFGQKFGDTMNPETVQKFGRIEGVQGLIFGRVVNITRQEQDALKGQAGLARVRVMLQAYEVETGRLLWGDEATGEIEQPLRDATPGEQAAAYGPWVAGVVLGIIVLLFLGFWVLKQMRPR